MSILTESISWKLNIFWTSAELFFWTPGEPPTQRILQIGVRVWYPSDSGFSFSALFWQIWQCCVKWWTELEVEIGNFKSYFYQIDWINSVQTWHIFKVKQFILHLHILKPILLSNKKDYLKLLSTISALARYARMRLKMKNSNGCQEDCLVDIFQQQQ